ncbi:MAG TPA: PQQ-binding-like beta-propeller repeat protein, partial [Longimicrobiales bacterium]
MRAGTRWRAVVALAGVWITTACEAAPPQAGTRARAAGEGVGAAPAASQATSPAQAPPPTASAAGPPATPGGGSPGEWTLPARDYAASRYSPLTQLTPANAPRLRPLWSFTTGALRGHEGQPLVVGNTMYVVTPFPNVLYAFDLTQEGYPLKWKYRPDVNP